MAITLKAGDKAPNFEAKDQDGKMLGLSDYAGSKLVLYFYPKDDTPGCTKEACNLRDHYQQLLAQGYRVLGVSVDDEASHQKFIAKYSLPFPLLADTDQKIVNAYGVWGEKNMYGKKFMGVTRATFIIDGAGIIQEVIKKVNTEAHAEQILNPA
ncbi:MAG: thioredoxin-dependent thiol peroxidase [Bacteroidetes bacterium]|jgi:peroxiredoxin Q/BCP|nr:thioredoxin-dependent thiol peroxidase [Bacteroidota bacterium]